MLKIVILIHSLVYGLITLADQNVSQKQYNDFLDIGNTKLPSLSDSNTVDSTAKNLGLPEIPEVGTINPQSLLPNSSSKPNTNSNTSSQVQPAATPATASEAKQPVPNGEQVIPTATQPQAPVPPTEIKTTITPPAASPITQDQSQTTQPVTTPSIIPNTTLILPTDKQPITTSNPSQQSPIKPDSQNQPAATPATASEAKQPVPNGEQVIPTATQPQAPVPPITEIKTTITPPAASPITQDKTQATQPVVTPSITSNPAVILPTDKQPITTSNPSQQSPIKPDSQNQSAATPATASEAKQPVPNGEKVIPTASQPQVPAQSAKEIKTIIPVDANDGHKQGSVPTSLSPENIPAGAIAGTPQTQPKIPQHETLHQESNESIPQNHPASQDPKTIAVPVPESNIPQNQLPNTNNVSNTSDNIKQPSFVEQKTDLSKQNRPLSQMELRKKEEQEAINFADEEIKAILSSTSNEQGDYLSNLSYNEYIKVFWNNFTTLRQQQKAKDIRKYLDNYHKFYLNKKNKNKKLNESIAKAIR